MRNAEQRYRECGMRSAESGTASLRVATFTRNILVFQSLASKYIYTIISTEANVYDKKGILARNKNVLGL